MCAPHFASGRTGPGRAAYHGAARGWRAFALTLLLALAAGCERAAPPPAAPEAAPLPPPRLWSLSPDVSALLVELGVAGSVLAADSDSLVLQGLADAADLGPGGDGALALVAALPPEHAVLLGDARGRALAEALAARGIPTTVLAPRSSNEVLDAVQRLGALVHRETRAAAVSARIARDVAQVAMRRDGRERLVAAWLLQREPPVGVGAVGLLHELLELAGAENAVHGASGERVALDAAAISRAPDVVLDSSQPPAPPGDPLLARGARHVRVPDELASLPALDLVSRVERLYALLYQGEGTPTEAATGR
jgi:ABC-type Fe3+-hydroxamate transport system substrate-binding protein